MFLKFKLFCLILTTLNPFLFSFHLHWPDKAPPHPFQPFSVILDLFGEQLLDCFVALL